MNPKNVIVCECGKQVAESVERDPFTMRHQAERYEAQCAFATPVGLGVIWTPHRCEKWLVPFTFTR